MSRPDHDFDKDLNLNPSEWGVVGRKPVDPPKSEPKSTGLSPMNWVVLIVTCFGIVVAAHGSPSLGLADDICLILFAAFCAWNYWPRS